MIRLEQMPGNDLKRGEVWNDLKIRYRKNRTLADGARDLGEKIVRIRNMLEYLNANRAVKFLILDRKNFFARFGLTVGQSAAVKNCAASWIELQAQPDVTGGNQRRTVRPGAATNIENARLAGQTFKHASGSFRICFL